MVPVAPRGWGFVGCPSWMVLPSPSSLFGGAPFTCLRVGSPFLFVLVYFVLFLSTKCFILPTRRMRESSTTQESHVSLYCANVRDFVGPLRSLMQHLSSERHYKKKSCQLQSDFCFSATVLLARFFFFGEQASNELHVCLPLPQSLEDVRRTVWQLIVRTGNVNVLRISLGCVNRDFFQLIGQSLQHRRLCMSWTFSIVLGATWTIDRVHRPEARSRWYM